MTAAASPLRILCIDDEANILSALRRLFRMHGYEVQVAPSGAEGVALMKQGPVDVVISDMRMPEMDGVQVLEQARLLQPEAVRILLTGYADVQLILGAINRGEIYRYITKPWDDDDLLQAVRQGLERKLLRAEQQRLEELTARQNEELRVLNTGLEAQVARRTAQLKAVHDELVVSNEKLKKNFITAIKMFSSIIEMRGAHLAGHSRRVADLARRIATAMGLDARESQQVFIAGLVHTIGKVGFADQLLALPVSKMNGEQLGLYRQYPERGEQLLMPLEDMREVAAIVRSHQERFDGDGFPDRLAGLNIPLGARILAVASAYDSYQIGLLVQNPLRPDQARSLIVDSRGKRYDPTVVQAFHEAVTGERATVLVRDQPRTLSQLSPGMRTTRDLVTKDGALLLSADHVLTERMIAQIASYERLAHVTLTIYVTQVETEAS
jgi:response regulator RpfG family c-di-GMP phosphodiesterase